VSADETVDLISAVRLLWPHSFLGGDDREVVLTWHGMLRDADAAEALAAVQELAAEGRDHAPPVGVVVKRVAERRSGLPEWDQAWEEMDTVIRRIGSSRPWRLEDFSHPAIAAFAVPAQKELCLGPAPGTSGFGTHYAQQREAYKALAGRTERDARNALVGVRREPLEGGGLRRLDFSSAVPSRPELESGS
jgi:hypothetical protein